MTAVTDFDDNAIQLASVMVWASAQDGKRYSACTTIQYGYKPACNTTTLTISTQSTEVMVTTKSPEHESLKMLIDALPIMEGI